jgi:polyisoprenoid-binding protein YceI
MRALRTLALSLLLLLLLPPPPSGKAGAADSRPFKIDTAASRVLVHVGKSGLFAFAGHEHEIIAPIRAGTVTLDPDHIERSSVELTFSAAQLRVAGRGEPDKDVPKVQQAMVGPDCLDAARFPDIRFVSRVVSRMRGAPAGLEVEVRGTITLHGFSREVAVPVHVTLGRDSLIATGTMTLRQSDFGISPISVAGVVKVKDAVTLEWYLVARG